MGRDATRPLAIVTGANGGMGRACARVLGAARDLVLTDASPALDDLARELGDEGFTVVDAIAGDLGSAEVLDPLARHAEARDGFEVLIHTAGLGPSAPWRAIVAVNGVASVRLVERLSPFARAGAAAVLIASVAGHMLPADPRLEAMLGEIQSPGFCDRLEPLLHELAGPAGERAFGTLAYCLTKKKTMDLCVENAARWGKAGARIVSISPGMIYTPMGREAADASAMSAQLVTGTPVGRWGTPMEIALAAQFLSSPAAGFITGCDLKVDGGSTAASEIASRGQWLKNVQNG